MASVLEPPRTKQRTEEPPSADIRDDLEAILQKTQPSPSTTDASKPFTDSWHVELATEEAAIILYKTLSVDAELNPTKVFREIAVDGKRLVVSFAATDERLLRTAVKGFKDMQNLAIRTLDEFGPDLMKLPS